MKTKCTKREKTLRLCQILQFLDICFFIMSVIYHEDSSHLAVREPDSKGLCHPLRGSVLDRIFCQGFDFPQRFAHGREKVTFSIPDSRVEHDQRLGKSFSFCHCHQLVLCCFQNTPVSARSCPHPWHFILVPTVVKSYLV